MQNYREQAKIELSQWLKEMGVNWDGKLTDLHKIDLSSSKLTTIPKSIGQLASLQELYLYENKLNSLPESICQLTNLQNLNLKNNKLR